jgi:hypothetical protein
MGVYVVAYDINKERQGWGNDRDKLRAKIKSQWPDWAYLSESAYAINTNDSVATVFTTLKPFLDTNDRLYVITLTRPWDGRGPQEVLDWLTARLGY